MEEPTKGMTFDDVEVDLEVIPKKFTESFDKPVLSFMLSSGGKQQMQKVVDTYGSLVHDPTAQGSGGGVEQMEKQRRILEAYNRKGGEAGQKDVIYYRVKWGGKPRGRRFAPGSLSLQSISRPIRHTIAGDMYFDADMKNCHPVALAHFCKQHAIPCPHLEQYNSERDTTFANLIKTTANTSMPLNKDSCKQLVLKIMNGGNINGELGAWGECAPAWIRRLYNEMAGIRGVVTLMFPTEYEEVKKEKDWNAEGSLLNRLLTILEDNALQYIFKFFTDGGHPPGVLCFDGLMVPRAEIRCAEEFDALCEECTTYVQTETGYPFVIVRKEMDEGFKDELMIPDEQNEADEVECDDAVELDAELQWLVDHFPVSHFDEQGHGIFNATQCLLHLGVPRHLIRDMLSVSLEEVEGAFSKYNRKTHVSTRSWLRVECAKGGADVAREMQVESEVDPKDNYCWLDFVKETHMLPYRDLYHAMDEVLPKVKRLLSVVAQGKLVVMVKDNIDNPYAMKELKDLFHTVCYYVVNSKGDKVLNEQRLSKFIEINLNLLPCFSNIVFKPNGVELNPWELNTWAGFRAKPVETINMEMVNPWLTHIRDVWADGNDQYYRYILSWIKHIVSHPERPSEIALIIKGAQGIGKTMVAQFLATHVFGKAISLTTTGLDSILGRFNKCIMSRVFINVNELTTVNESFHSAFDKLKPLITDHELQIEPKFCEQIKIQNCANFLCTTNHDFTVKLEETDRRYACFTCSPCKLGDEGYFNSLGACQTDAHGDQFFTYITSEFQDVVSLKKVPQTELRSSMMDSSKLASVRFMEELHEYPEQVVGKDGKYTLYQLHESAPQLHESLPDHPDRVLKSTLYELFKQWAQRNGEKPPANNVFYRQIKQFGEPGRPRVGGQKVQCWRFENPPKFDAHLGGGRPNKKSKCS